MSLWLIYVGAGACVGLLSGEFCTAALGRRRAGRGGAHLAVAHLVVIVADDRLFAYRIASVICRQDARTDLGAGCWLYLSYT